MIRIKGKFVTKAVKIRMGNLVPKQQVSGVLNPSEDYPVKGRRLVNLQHLARALFCNSCREPIPLANVIEEKSLAGLCSYLKVCCNNCGAHKTVTTDTVVTVGKGKRARTEYPVNKKFTFGNLIFNKDLYNIL